MNFKKVKLSDIGKIVGGGTPSTKNPNYYGGNIPWLSPKDLTGYKFRYISKGESNISNEGLKNSSAKIMPAGSVLMSSRAPIGYLAIAQNEVCTNQGFKSVVPNPDLVNSEYLYYCLKYHVPELQGLGVGTTFAEISGTAFGQFEINLPDLSNQEKIATMLSSIDDKIELNIKINANLGGINFAF